MHSNEDVTKCRAALLSCRLSLVLPAYILVSLILGTLASDVVTQVSWLSTGIIWILAALGVFAIVTVPISMVLGIIALHRISRSGGQLIGKEYAVSGIAITLITSIMLCCGYIMFLNARENARAISCRSNMKQLGLAFQQYAYDHKGMYPPPNKWIDELYPYVKSRYVFRCLSADTNKPTYAMNIRLRGQREKDIKNPHSTVVLFDSVPGDNLTGGPELLPTEARHKKYNILFADGQVRGYDTQDIRKLMAWGD